MQTDLIRFPGDPITADLWNRMLALIDSLNGRIDAQEARVVPDVVGDLFPTALDEIAISQLALNTVFDVDGTKGNPDDPALKGRIVIAQMPAPEERVPTGSRVTLLITAQKVVQANAPTVKEVKPEPAQVGKPLDIAGTNFDPNVRVSIRNTQLAANEFNVIGTTQIHIPTVPDFDGAPAPGTTKEIPITVANKAGDGSLPVKFASPETPAARPAVTNVRLLDPTRLRLIGKDLVQSGQVTTVTMGGEDRPFKPQSDGVDILMPGAMAAAFQALPPAVFDLLAKLDARDALLVNIAGNPFQFTGGGPAVNPELGGPAPAEFARVAFFFTTMKLFLTMGSLTAQQAQSGKTQVVGNTVTLTDFAGKPIFSVDVMQLQDLSVIVKVGDKSTTFVVKFGSVPDRVNPGGGGFAGGGRIVDGGRRELLK